jgi:hypothetical protein
MCNSLWLCRYGGLTFGERNDLLKANDTDVDSVFEELAAAAGGEDVVRNSNVSLPQLLLDLEDLIENLVTKRNAKVDVPYAYAHMCYAVPSTFRSGSTTKAMFPWCPT